MTQRIPKPVVLLILDGLGIDVPGEGNAVTSANTPVLDKLWQKYSHTSLQASQHYVGLPAGVMGNSEVGHMTIGAGRVLKQELVRIDDAIRDGSFFENEVFLQVINHVKEHNSKLHFFGLVSDGRIHASDEHLYTCLDMCARNGLAADQVVIHIFADGRDSAPKSVKGYIEELKKQMVKFGVGRIATITGRYYAMDRDERWDRTESTYNAMFKGEGREFSSVEEAIDAFYMENTTDEFFTPSVITGSDGSSVSVSDGDGVICFNFRADRVEQLSHAIVDEEFTSFDREKKEVMFAGFSNYKRGVVGGNDEADVPFPDLQLFPPLRPEHTLGEVISQAGKKQLRISESEKYPHVTYFFNNRKNTPFTGEDRVEIPSPRDVANYDEKPEMSTYEITERTVREIENNDYDFILVNFAATDLVAHTGDLQAAIKAVEVADECLGRIYAAVLEKGGEMIVTADHGNAEGMINPETGEPDTSHSLNPVPLVYITERNIPSEVANGTLVDIATTILSIMQLEPPAEMTGRDLFAGY